MKRLVLISLLAASMAYAGWFRTYGGSGWDEGHCVQEVEDGYVVVGSQTLSSGKVALWLLKTDTLGDTVWSKNYGGINNTEAVGNFVRQTQDGYIIAGSFWNWNNGTVEIWLLKTNSEGDTLWTKTFGQGLGRCVQGTSDNNYVIIGQRLWGMTSFPSRLILIKTKPQGDSLWAYTYLLSNWAYSSGFFVQQTDDQGYIVTGVIGDTTFEADRRALWLFKTDSLGNTSWTYTQGGEEWFDEDYGQCVRQTREGNYIVAGRIDNKAFMLKANSNGDTLWSRSYGFSEASACLEKREKEEYALTGNALKVLASSKSLKQGGSWLLSVNAEGDSLWARNYDAGANYHFEETQDNGFIITGYKEGNLFLLKTDSLGLLGIAENPIIEADNGWNVANTIGNHIVMSYKDMPLGFHAKVYDVAGREVDEVHASGSWGTTFWGFEQPAGVYYIKALDNTNHEKSVKVVITD